MEGHFVAGDIDRELLSRLRARQTLHDFENLHVLRCTTRVVSPDLLRPSLTLELSFASTREPTRTVHKLDGYPHRIPTR